MNKIYILFLFLNLFAVAKAASFSSCNSLLEEHVLEASPQFQFYDESLIETVEYENLKKLGKGPDRAKIITRVNLKIIEEKYGEILKVEVWDQGTKYLINFEIDGTVLIEQTRGLSSKRAWEFRILNGKCFLHSEAAIATNRSPPTPYTRFLITICREIYKLDNSFSAESVDKIKIDEWKKIIQVPSKFNNRAYKELKKEVRTNPSLFNRQVVAVPILSEKEKKKHEVKSIKAEALWWIKSCNEKAVIDLVKDQDFWTEKNLTSDNLKETLQPKVKPR